ncbi:MAG: peptidylprolyl isomerase [Pseudomonadota bacterium]
MYNEVNACHVLVKTKEEAEQLKTDVDSGKSFEDIAKENSLCPSGKEGGSLGWFGKGAMVKEFEDMAWNMQKGDTSEPFQTQFGWHLIKLLDTK